jgi:hypothetical protein
MSWAHRNLAVQGYCLSAEESHALRWGLRFPTALCLGLAVTGLALQSGSGAPELPPNTTPRRHAFKLATIWLLAIGLLFAFGQPTAALILGGILLAVCGVLTVTNFCLPSTMLSIWWRRRGAAPPATQPS